MKKIFIVTLFTALLLLSIFPTAAAAEIPDLDSKTFETMWRNTCGYYNTMYDVGDIQVSPQVTVFFTDSKGVPYAGGKAYVYGIFEKQYTTGEIMEQTKIKYSKVLTDDLVNSIVGDFHVSDGPDIEQVRVDADGNLYKLHLISFGSLKNIKSINVSNDQAHVTCDIEISYTFSAKGAYTGNDTDLLSNTVIDLIYTDDGWRISGGEVFDYVRNFANVYPGAEYDTAPSTGDESDKTLGAFAAGAMIAALIPAVLIIPYRRKKRFEA